MQKKKGDFYFLSLIWLMGSAFFSLSLSYGQSPAVLHLSPGSTLELSKEFEIALIPSAELPDVAKIAFIPLSDFDQGFQSHQDYLIRFSLRNQSSKEVKAFFALGNWSYLDLLTLHPGSHQEWIPMAQGGHFRNLGERTYAKNQLLLPFQLAPFQSQEYYIRLKQEMKFYLPTRLELEIKSAAQVEQQEAQRLFYQGLFLGIILVMALYNLAIYFSVRDLSFFFYVCSILGLGFYFLFYYGFALELLWPFAPRWNAFSFVLFVPFTRISWVLFTRYYLNTPAILPTWNRLLDGLIILYLIPLGAGFVSYCGYWDLSILTVNWIGSLGVIVLIMMLWLGYLAWRQGFAPARYFLLANIFFSLGTILFILRETGVLSDNFITIYSVQFGAVVQVVLFSLGLGNRLKEAREELLEKEMEKQLMRRTQEREKQKLIEQQKADLEIQVSERTQDLEEKAFELEQTILRLQDSESKLQDLNNLKDKFFSIISHDLRSPIATLNSFLNILINHSGKISPQEFRDLANKTQNATERLSLLLDNLLQWAMSQMKQLSFCPTQVDIEALIQENIDILGVSAEEKQVAIKKQIPQDLTLRVDRNMLSFVMRNLMHNAIKFTPPGGWLQITLLEEEEHISFIIEDNGIGMSPDQISRLTNPETPLSTRGTAGEKGSGLGILLCREFIEKHGGTLAVQSELQKGTRFVFSIQKENTLVH